MDLSDQLKNISDRYQKAKDNIKTEEATKMSLIAPFLQALGYDVADPMEVVPEFTADIGTKKGEKVDYAILNEENAPVILIECKHWGENLDLHKSQLLRYFNVTHARFGILTNGVTYHFFTDLVEPNKMDEKPFLDFSIHDISEATLKEVKKFSKSQFDLESILSNASDLKYSGEIKAMLSQEFKDPSPDFVKYFAQRIYPGKVTARIQEQFTELMKQSLAGFISQKVNERLKTALDVNGISEKEEDMPTEDASVGATEANAEEDGDNKDSKINTTSDEMQAFFLVKSILRKHVEPARIAHRDTQSYFGVLLDDNNRKPLCRLWLENGKKYIGLFDESKNVTRHELSSLDDIYHHEEGLVKTLEFYS